PRSYTLSDGLRRDLDVELARGYDVLHLDPLWAGYLAKDRPRALGAVHNLESVDLRGVASPSWRLRATRRLVARAERRLPTRLRPVGWNARTALAQHLSVPGLEVVENVPDARPYFQRLQVFAYPLPQGSGMMAKILEAMAYGVPIVTTTEGVEGYGIRDRVHA